MSFKSDVCRFNNKLDNVNKFKISLLSFEDIRISLQRDFRYDVFTCKCGNGQAASGDSVLTYPFVEYGPGICGHNLLRLPSASAYKSLTGSVSHLCSSCGDPSGLVPEVCSAIECNPTVINDGLNDALRIISSSCVGLLCYKFSLHFCGERSEPVYLVLYATKKSWNYILSGIATVVFKDRSMPSVRSFDLDVDVSSRRFSNLREIRDVVESLLISDIK